VPEILARCGYRCDMCLAYRPNVEASPANGQILSDGWHKYFGFRIAPGEIVCDGCRADGLRLIDSTCRVRPCVIGRTLSDCSECPDYGCEKLNERLVVFEDVVARSGRPIPDEDRARFIAPYENKRRLDGIRGRGR
jgi:Protein of unknown function (DUF3795)